MKYSDQQRVEKIRETTEKLLDYVRTEHITPDVIFEKNLSNGLSQRRCIISESTQQTCRMGSGMHTPISHGSKSQDCAIGWCITMRIPTGRLFVPSSSIFFRAFWMN